MLQGLSDSFKAIFHGIIKHSTATRLRTVENLNYNILQLLAELKFLKILLQPLHSSPLLHSQNISYHLIRYRLCIYYPFFHFESFISFNTSSHLPKQSTRPHFWGNYFVQFIYISTLHSGSTLQTTFYVQILWNF